MTAACCRRHGALQRRDGACGPLTSDDCRVLAEMAAEAQQSIAGASLIAALRAPPVAECLSPLLADSKSLARALAATLEQLAEVTRERDSIALAAKDLLDSLGEMMRQTMLAAPEWRSGVVAMKQALGMRGVEAEHRLMQERDAAIARVERAERDREAIAARRATEARELHQAVAKQKRRAEVAERRAAIGSASREEVEHLQRRAEQAEARLAALLPRLSTAEEIAAAVEANPLEPERVRP